MEGVNFKEDCGNKCILLHLHMFFCASFNYRLNHTYSQLLRDNEILQTDHKNLKSLLNNSKLEQTRLEAEFSKLKEQYQQLDITSTKLNNQCEVIKSFTVF